MGVYLFWVAAMEVAREALSSSFRQFQSVTMFCRSFQLCVMDLWIYLHNLSICLSLKIQKIYVMMEYKFGQHHFRFTGCYQRVIFYTFKRIVAGHLHSMHSYMYLGVPVIIMN